MKKKIALIISASILVIIVGVTAFLYQNRDLLLVNRAMKQAKNMDIDAMFLSMYPVATYNEEILYASRGETTEILPVTWESGEQLVGILEEILENPNQLKRIYLGIYVDSVVQAEVKGDLPTYDSDLLAQGYSWEEAILELGKAYPDKIFEIMLYYPQISYWTAMEQEQVTEIIDWYAYAGDLYSHYDVVENVHVFMPGSEEWLICNESNYLDKYNVTDVVANELEKLVLSDYECIMVPISVQEQCDRLLALIDKYRENKPVYGEQSEYTYVFLGDSVIGNYTDSMSIPGVVSYMTGADTINCGFGGLTATKLLDTDIGIAGIVDSLLATGADRNVASIENETTQAGIQEFWDADIATDTEKLVFFISYGINDYCTGCPIYNDNMDDRCYIGALSNAIDKLQAAYPNAEIILMTPNYIELFEHGSWDISGQGFVFADFAEAIILLGQEKNLPVIDVYQDLGITAENTGTYLLDGCHPNYYGRFKIGEMIWEYIRLQRQ